MNSSQIRCFWAYTALIVVLTTIPYAVGLGARGSDEVFTGFVFGVQDGNSYIAKMLLGATGDWLFRTPYSAQGQQGVPAFLPYILLGKLAAGSELHLQLVLLFHLFRIAVIPLAVWSTYTFIDHFLHSDRWSSWGTVLATIGGGLGWIVLLIGGGVLRGSIPLDFISPETFGFLAYFGLPHLLLARALLLLGLRWYLESEGARSAAWKAGGVFFALGFVQPLTLAPAYAVIGVHQLLTIARTKVEKWSKWRARWWPTLVRVLLPSLPVFAYFFITFSTDPFLRKWTAQNLILSPHIYHYLLAYGVVLPFMIAGLIKAWSSGERKWLLPIGWTLMIPLLAYAPHNLQRRLPEGSWTAVVLLAALGLSRLRIRERVQGIFRVAIVLISLVTPVVLIVGGVQVAGTRSFPVFRPRTETDAFVWLRDNAEKDSVVLTSFETGNALPAWAPVHVVVGHGPESADLKDLLPRVQAFFSGEMTESEAASFVQEQGVDYVFYGPREKDSLDQDEFWTAGMQVVYADGEYSIIKTTGP